MPEFYSEDNQTNKSEDLISSEEIKPETTNPNEEIENMEVHHHAHDPAAPHHKKNWKNYFWEFLMLFLAVFCGFLAEYQLEHKIERDREIQYVRSLMNDLKTDTTNLSKNLKGYKQSHLRQDTAMELFPSLKNGFKQRFFKNYRGFTWFPDFIYTDATIQQLKNSGGFRLIRNQKVVDSIMSYDGVVKKALINEQQLVKKQDKTFELYVQIININSMAQQIKKGKSLKQLEDEGFEPLLVREEIALSQYANQLYFHSSISKVVARNMQEVKTKAERLLIFIQKEYDIE